MNISGTTDHSQKSIPVFFANISGPWLYLIAPIATLALISAINVGLRMSLRAPKKQIAVGVIPDKNHGNTNQRGSSTGLQPGTPPGTQPGALTATQPEPPTGTQSGTQSGTQPEPPEPPMPPPSKPKISFRESKLTVRANRKMTAEIVMPEQLRQRLTDIELAWDGGSTMSKPLKDNRIELDAPNFRANKSSYKLTIISTDLYDSSENSVLEVVVARLPVIALPARITSPPNSPFQIAVTDPQSDRDDDVTLRIQMSGRTNPIDVVLPKNGNLIELTAPEIPEDKISQAYDLSLVPAADYEIAPGSDSSKLIVSWERIAISLEPPNGPVMEGARITCTIASNPIARPLTLNYRVGAKSHEVALQKNATSFELQVPSDGIPLVDREEKITLIPGDGYTLRPPKDVATIAIQDNDPLAGDYVVAILDVSDATAANAELTLESLRLGFVNQAGKDNLALCGGNVYTLSAAGWTLPNAGPRPAACPAGHLALESVQGQLSRWSQRVKGKNGTPKLVILWPYLNRDLRLVEQWLDSLENKELMIDGAPFSDFVKRQDVKIALLGSAGTTAGKLNQFWCYPNSRGEMDRLLSDLIGR